VGLPIVSYMLMVGGAAGIGLRHPLGFASVAGAVLLLLVTGIRNAWDLVLWVTQQRRTGA
jgi:hypothetical protein